MEDIAKALRVHEHPLSAAKQLIVAADPAHSRAVPVSVAAFSELVLADD